MLPDAIRNTVVSGAVLYGLALFSPWPKRRWAALLLLAISVGLGFGLRYLIPEDLLHLPFWSGLAPECALLPLWALYGVLARRAARPWVVGPAWVVAPLLGAVLGEVPAAAILGAAAPDAAAAGRLALAAAAGGLIGRIGDPAVLVLVGRVPNLWWGTLPVAAILLVLARPRRSDLRSDGQGNKLVTGLALATALAAAVPGWTLPALCFGTLGMGALAALGKREGPVSGGCADIAWAVGSVGLVLISVAGGLPDLIATALEQGSDFLGRLPLPLLTAASGLISAMVDAPATALLTAATLDRCPSLVEPGLGLALGLGAAVGGVGPLVAAGALWTGWKRWLVALILACVWVGVLSPWLAPP